MAQGPDFTVRIHGTEILNEDRRIALEDLIDSLRQDGLDGEIAYRPPTGRGVLWWEVVAIYVGGKFVDAVTGQIIKAALDQAVGRVTTWAKARLRRGDTSRPQSITLYGPNGEVLKEIKVDKDSLEDPER